jgi:hypothetical protein
MKLLPALVFKNNDDELEVEVYMLNRDVQVYYFFSNIFQKSFHSLFKLYFQTLDINQPRKRNIFEQFNL